MMKGFLLGLWAIVRFMLAAFGGLFLIYNLIWLYVYGVP